MRMLMRDLGLGQGKTSLPKPSEGQIEVNCPRGERRILQAGKTVSEK